MMGRGYSVLNADGTRRTIMVGHLPGRKSTCLYSEVTTSEGSVLYVMAYLRNEGEAMRCLALLDSLAGGTDAGVE